MYIWYVALFFVLLVVELLSYNLTTIWIALGSLLTAIYAYFFPTQVITQVILLLVLSLTFILLTKPLMQKIKYAKEKTNADRLVDMEGIVLESINPLEGMGQVKVAGQIWSAKTEDGTVVLTGEKIKIIKIEGVKLVVERKETLCRN